MSSDGSESRDDLSGDADHRKHGIQIDGDDVSEDEVRILLLQRIEMNDSAKVCVGPHASDVTNFDDVCSVLDKMRYPEEAAASLKIETEKLRVAAVRAFRRRCIQAASASCILLLFLLLYRAGRFPLRLRRLIASLLLRLRRR